MTGWNADTSAGSIGAGAVTLVEGASFCISAGNGDMHAGRPHGAFFSDTRILSKWNLTVNGEPVQPLGATTPEPYRAVFVGRAAGSDGAADNPLVVERERVIGSGIREQITVRNFSREPAECTLELIVGTDFADLFEVKDGRSPHHRDQSLRQDGGSLILDCQWKGSQRGLIVQAPGATIDGGSLSYRVVLEAHGAWTRAVAVIPTVNGVEASAAFSADRATHESLPALRFGSWGAKAPVVQLENAAIEKVLNQSQGDLGSLRIFNPDHPGRAVLAAGAPWFMALFGRDSLLSSLMALPVDPSLALGTLQTLAEFQGKEVNPLSEEEPGRILHEVRLGVSAGLSLGGGSIYYGTADATPLFVSLLGELSRWGLAGEAIDALLPHADRALDWISNYGDRDGDGFVEYARANEHGLINQGWKDSWDGINFANGDLAEAPIALCEVQGYVYSAYIGRALMAVDAGDAGLARDWGTRAAALKKAFNERFWLPDLGYFAIALDKDKKPVDACASNMGHCLWSGIIDDDKAAAVAKRLMSPEMFTGWGVRTLGSDMGAYNPVSYHNGSVWPHDNALIAGGLMRYGFVEEAQKIALGLFEAADYFGGRLPELFCGFDRGSYPEPVSYPTSCSPQAWAAATPIYLIRILLRFDPFLPYDGLWLSPVFPESFGHFREENMPLAGSRLTVEVSDNTTSVTGLPDRVRLHRGTRPPLAELLQLSGLQRS
ncbi:glycogen debranching N-terminal domain-containing protein [Micrococcaceae bacterium Sec5.7]